MALGPAGPLDHLPGGLTPRREFPRPRPGPPTAATPAPAASPVPTVPIPSDRDRAEPVETPLLRLTPPLGDTPPAPGKLDALGHATKLQFDDSVARYSHADWERQQQAEPTCHAARRYITIGRPSALPADFCRATLCNQTPLPPDADWRGAALALPELRGAFFGARLRLCPTRGVALLLP